MHATAVAEPEQVSKDSEQTKDGEFGRAGETHMTYCHLDELFIDDSLNARKQYPEEKMEEMYESILANHGIYMPLVVANSKPGSTKTDRPYTLVAGFRRAKGLEMVRDRLRRNQQDPAPFIESVPIVVLVNVDVENFHVVQLVENLVRQDLNPIEAGDAIERALAESKDPATGKGITARHLASQLGLSEAKVSQLRAIVSTLPDYFKEAIGKGEVSFVNARTVVAVPVPAKFYRQVLKMARTSSGPEFEAYCRKRWGSAAETGKAGSGEATGGQKGRATRPVKDVKEIYLPELKKRAEAAKGNDKLRLQANIDAIKWLTLEEGTELGKSLIPFEEKLHEQEEAEKATKAQESAKTRLLNQLTSLMRKHISRPLEEGETKPTRDQALDLAMATVTKGYDANAKTYPVPAGRVEQGKAETVTQFSIPDLAVFKTQLLTHWGTVEKKKREDKQKRMDEKKAAEEAAKRGGSAQAEAAATGVQTNVADNAQGERAAGGMNKQNEGEVAVNKTTTDERAVAADGIAKDATKQGTDASSDGGQGDKAAATGDSK